MEPVMHSIKKGIRGIRRVASKVVGVRQTTQNKPTDLSRAMVEMKTHTKQTKTSVKTHQTNGNKLGSLLDERV
jgi:hypothetical protein